MVLYENVSPKFFYIIVVADTIVGGPTTLKVHFIFVSVQQQRDVYDLSLHLEDELDIYTISEFDGQ